MKKINKFLWLILFPLVLGSCLGEDNDDCPGGCYIRFEARNPKHNIKEITNTLDLYLYKEDGNLYRQFHFTKSDLRPEDGAVHVPQLPEAKYKTVALINHDPNDYNLLESDKFTSIYSEVLKEQLDTPPADLFIGIAPIEFSRHDEAVRTVTMAMGKQTNRIKLNIDFQGIPPAGTMISTYIYGDNGMFRHSSYSCSYGNYRTYFPHHKANIVGEVETEYNFTTMSLWVDADTKLILEESRPKRAVDTRTITIDLIDLLTKVQNDQGEYLYDTNEKLEYNDEYEVTLTLSPDFVILGITIDNWAIIDGGVEV